MLQNLKNLSFSVSLLSLLSITGCTSHQSTYQYNRPYSYDSYETIRPQQKKIYKSNYTSYNKMKFTPKKIIIFHQNKTKGESTFEKILKNSKYKSIKSIKIKRNDCREKFPSNVPRDSIQ